MMLVYTLDLERLNFLRISTIFDSWLGWSNRKTFPFTSSSLSLLFYVKFFQIICYLLRTSLWTPRYGVDLVWRRQSMQMYRKRRVIFIADIASGLLDNRRHRNPGLLLQLLMMMADQAAISRVLWRHVVASALQPLHLASLVLEPHFHLHNMRHAVETYTKMMTEIRRKPLGPAEMGGNVARFQ